MKKFNCLILSLILALSVGSVNVLAVEDTGEVFQFETGEENLNTSDIALPEFENDGVDETDSNDNDSEIIDNEEDETSVDILIEDEGKNREEPQNTDEGSDEIELLDELQEETDESGEAKWTELAPLSLKYDDRYSLEDLLETFEDEYVILDIIGTPTSHQVVKGETSDLLDESVITQQTEGSLDIVATGVGTAAIYLVPFNQEGTDGSTEGTDQTEDPEQTENAGSEDSDQNNEPDPVENGLKIEVTVKPATLTLMYLTGQSNMEGLCSESTGPDLDASIANKEGVVYSTYAPTNDNSEDITGVSFSKVCNVDNAADFVAGSLRSNASITEKELEYPLDSLTINGKGKTGPDSGLAYEWNLLTKGDKVWVINTAWSGTNIASWQPGASLYERSLAVWNCVKQVYNAEIDAGHYTKGNRLAFWLQGETGDKTSSTEYYKSDFSNMYADMKSVLDLDAMGIIMVRASTGSYTTDDEWEMTGPRTAQYILGGSSGIPGVYVVSNANEQWVSDAGVKSYFEETYSGGGLDYPMHNGSSVSLPETVNDVHSDIHYSQIGHNENGITAAYGMYQALVKSADPVSVEWRGESGRAVSSLSFGIAGDTAILVPVTDPVYAAKKISYSVSGDVVSYDSSTGVVTALSTEKENETANITAIYNDEIMSQVSVTIDQSTNLRAVAGNYTGIYYYQGTYWYLEDGIIQTQYEGVEKNENGWWYINKGRVDFSYTGFAKNSNGWWYIEDGKVTFNKNSVIQDVNKKIDGTNSWWYVVESKVQTDFTGLADYSNSNGWWYINNGKVTFDVCTVAKNKNGWYYVKDSKVDFSYNGFEKNSNGWWYIEDGKVTFNKNSVLKDTNKKIDGTTSWWFVDGSKVQTGYTGVANYKNENGWWYVKNGKVDFSANTVAKNKNGWWYVLEGKVQFGFTGLADYKNSNGWWYINNGKVTFNVNTVAKNKNGWWYVKNSKVDFGFNGIASNANGRWYLKGGKVDFTYNGTCNYNGKRYTIVNGKVK